MPLSDDWADRAGCMGNPGWGPPKREASGFTNPDCCAMLGVPNADDGMPGLPNWFWDDAGTGAPPGELSEAGAARLW